MLTHNWSAVNAWNSSSNRYRHKDGSWRTFSWRSVPRGKLMYASARDVTDAVRAELELREAKEQLEVRVAERTRELEQSHEALSSSERRFRALIENSTDGIVLIDATGHVPLRQSGGH